MAKLIYFAWVRERIGKREEELELPTELTSVADLLGWLREKGDGYEEALRKPEVIRVAINEEHVDHYETLEGAHRIALFPPMTGG